MNPKNDNAIEVICCFCGNNIDSRDPDPIYLIIPLPCGGQQKLTSHIKCLQKTLHKSIPLGIFDDDKSVQYC
jgi:hypothetical protein